MSSTTIHVDGSQAMSVDLPPELEREIFEFAGLSCPGCIPTLMLVSRAVCEWMEPHLYHIMIFTLPQAPLLLATLRTRSPSFISSTVRKLFISDDPVLSMSSDDIQTILSRCSGTTDLFFAVRGRVYLPLISAMPLQRLSAPIPSIFAGPVDFTHALFANLTHLCVFPLMRDDPTQWAGLYIDVLQRCSNLHVLVNFYFTSGSVGSQRDGDLELAHDVRYVRMKRGFYAKDWKVGVYGGRDYWTRADEWVAKRTLGEVHQLEYVVPDQ
ncbi:hypothetical protein B0H14DRAFT_2779764 [Mycena olivaceomarginata]|nr:hypothetical protein B0H14DRAFT_2779764 [Mycena olivaceomarginata]